MRKIYLLLLVLLPQFYALAQKRWGARDVIRLEDANIYLEITDYKSALDLFVPLYEEYGAVENMEYKIGLCYYNLEQHEEAREYFSRAEEHGNPNAAYYLGKYFHEYEEFDKAIRKYQAFRYMEGDKDYEPAEVDRLIEISERAKEMMKNPIQAKVYNIGPSVNSEYDDYGPVISADESMMAYTSRREGTTGDKKDPYGEYLEDIYISFNESDQWKKSSNIGEPLNTNTHDAVVGLSPDGNSMIIYRTNKDLSAGDLYISEDVNGKWSEPEKLSENINSEYQESSASLTQDGRVIYFSSDRPGGHGGKDIYRVVRLGNNEWSLPLNLGPTINTKFDEDAPFIHPNGKTLYFSSKGHKTIGGYDIFKSTLGEDYWSIPENLGYPANTVRHDIFFVLAADGNRGYYSTRLPEGFGGHDIYVVSFENALESLRIIKGKVTNGRGKALQASITLMDEDGNEAGVYNTNALTGNYIIILPPDENFTMILSAEGYDEIKDSLYYQGGTNTRERNQSYTLKSSM